MNFKLLVMSQNIDLPTDANELRAFAQGLLTKLDEKNNLLQHKDHEIKDLRSLIDQMKRRMYGSSSEVVSSDQLDFTFDEAEAAAAKTSADDDEYEDINYTRKKKGRKPIPDDLPREEVIIEVPQEERCCPHGHEYKVIGYEESEKVEFTPATLKVFRIKREKRACECIECEAVKTAEPVASIIPKSIATASLLTFILISKYVDHLSLYRISAVFSRLGFNLPRQTLANWMIKVGVEFSVLINLLEEELLADNYVFCDETRVQVLREDGKTAQSQSQMWVRARNGPRPIILYEYDPTRSGATAERLLEGFKGYLHADGYPGYNAPARQEYVVRVADMYHIRRKFEDAYKEAKKNKGDVETSRQALRFIKKLSKIEVTIAEASEHERFITRLRKSKPIMDEFKEWLDEKKQSYRPTSPLGKAVNYALGQWQDMMQYLSHGRLEMHTNFVENAIRPFALGRKNWLFSTSVDGAQSSAKIYSIIETAKANGIDPHNYVRHLLEKLPLATTLDDYEQLLPWNVNLPRNTKKA